MRRKMIPPDTYQEAYAVAMAAWQAEDWRWTAEDALEEARMVASYPVSMTVASYRMAADLAYGIENTALDVQDTFRDANETGNYAAFLEEVTKLQETCRRLKRWARTQASHGTATSASL